MLLARRPASWEEDPPALPHGGPRRRRAQRQRPRQAGGPLAAGRVPGHRGTWCASTRRSRSRSSRTGSARPACWSCRRTASPSVWSPWRRRPRAPRSWRRPSALPVAVRDGETGYLVQGHDPAATRVLRRFVDEPPSPPAWERRRPATPAASAGTGRQSATADVTRLRCTITAVAYARAMADAEQTEQSDQTRQPPPAPEPRPGRPRGSLGKPSGKPLGNGFEPLGNGFRESPPGSPTRGRSWSPRCVTRTCPGSRRRPARTSSRSPAPRSSPRRCPCASATTRCP